MQSEVTITATPRHDGTGNYKFESCFQNEGNAYFMLEAIKETQVQLLDTLDNFCKAFPSKDRKTVTMQDLYEFIEAANS